MASRKVPKKSKKRTSRAFTPTQHRIIQAMIQNAITSHEDTYHDVTAELELMTSWPQTGPDPIKDEVEEARRKLEAGFDLTPEEFPLPPTASYFGKADDGETPLQPGFTERYFVELRKHQDQKKAYIATCSVFGLPDYERPS